MRRHRSFAVAAVAAAAVVAGCQGSGGSGSTVSATPPPATNAPATTTTGGSVCSDLVVSGQALVTVVTQFVSGQATGDQVRASASQLSASIDAARTTIGGQTSARLDDAKAALQRLQAAATAQPVDVAGMRAAAGDTLAALRDAAAVCQSGTPAPTSG
ncbi:hypothetical protein HFP15_05500 [Amycolatopsis sp. K13G38]|uniref:Uncharacterized protein n=1 Tax=Amycolatopsis acididurans TaxID=2724524 RepID=A0ABX1IYV3_9PSEU|nr:hypothetical protein [Amycolatopsis acididurans]